MIVIETAYSLLEKFGAEAQTKKAIEEMAELTVQLAKRLNGNTENGNEILDELADVQIMIWQLVEIYASAKSHEKKIEDKLKRSKERYNL